MIVNISSVKSFQRCRLRWLYEWHLGRVPRRGHEALEFGKLLHRAFEYHFEGREMGVAIDLAVAELALTHRGDEVAAKSIAELLSYREVLEQWRDKYPITETLEVEQPFEMPHTRNPDLILRGRPDRVVVCYGKTFHVQNRSLAGGKNIGLYLELAKQDMHELVYAWAITKKYPQYEYGGTLFNLVRKLKYRGAITKAFPEGKPMHTLDEILVQAAIPILPAFQEQALEDLLWIATEMNGTVEDYNGGRGWLPARNRELDGGYFGHSLDAYWPVITGQTTLANNELYKNREDPYAADGHAG